MLSVFPARLSARHDPSLARQIDDILASSPARRAFWGIEVVRLSDGKRLYARNADHLFQPASNLKLFTAAAAITRLSPDFIFRTTVESPALPDPEGRIPELTLVGRGDPNLGSRVLPYRVQGDTRSPADADFQELADEVRAKGVREITGNLVADDRYYVYQPYGPNWAIDDMVWGYGAPVTALAFNDNSLKLTIQRGSAIGTTPEVTLAPLSNYYTIINNLRFAAADTSAHFVVERPPGSMTLLVWGQIPQDSDPIAQDVAIQDPPQLIGEMFRSLLKARGIKVDGQVTVHRRMPDFVSSAGPEPQPTLQNILAEHDSLPLREDLKLTLKVSQNLHAEMLLRTMARQLVGEGSIEAGVKILDDFAREVHVPSDQFYFADGSGLSRDNLLSPDALIKLLEYMPRSDRFRDFFDALPVAGMDGTLADRFEHTVAQGRIHAKTGTMEHVNALSGYMDLPGGRRLAFSILVNNAAADSAATEAILDRIALAIYRALAAASPQREKKERSAAR